MSVFLITYDLDIPGQDYDKILNVIKSYDYAMLCKSSYVVDTDDLQGLTKKIYDSIDKSTEAFIFPIENPIFITFGSHKTEKWLKAHLGKIK